MLDVEPQENLQAFDCPVHGIELDKYCWLAFKEEYKSRWITFRPASAPTIKLNKEQDGKARIRNG